MEIVLKLKFKIHRTVMSNGFSIILLIWKQKYWSLGQLQDPWGLKVLSSLLDLVTDLGTNIFVFKSDFKNGGFWAPLFTSTKPPKCRWTYSDTFCPRNFRSRWKSNSKSSHIHLCDSDSVSSSSLLYLYPCAQHRKQFWHR